MSLRPVEVFAALTTLVVVATIVAGGWILYKHYNPGDVFFRSELARATGIQLPDSASLVGTCSKWYDTAAVYEIDSEHWPDVKARFASAGTPGAIFGDFKTRECDPSLRSLLSVPDTAATVAVGRDQLYWSTDTSQRRVYWQVSVD